MYVVSVARPFVRFFSIVDYFSIFQVTAVRSVEDTMKLCFHVSSILLQEDYLLVHGNLN